MKNALEIKLLMILKQRGLGFINGTSHVCKSKECYEVV